MAIEEGYCPFYAGEYRNFVLNSNNMSYGATVGASAANTVKQFNKILKNNFNPLSLINPIYTATFQSGLLTILKMLKNLDCLFVVVDI